MSVFKIVRGWLMFFMIIALCSCAPKSNIPRKNRKLKPCDCPPFGYAPQQNVIDTANAYFFV